MAPAKLAFGVEIEMLLKPKAKGMLINEINKFFEANKLAQLTNTKDWASGFEVVKKAQVDSEDPAKKMAEAAKTTAKANAEKYRAAFRSQFAKLVTAQYGLPAALKSATFQEWQVVEEPSLDEIPGYCRVEFVSRTIASDDDWQDELDRLFKFVSEQCDVKLTTGCSTHVHVSPSASPRGKEDKWSTLNLRAIMKALSYYDDSITRVMPTERKNNPYALSNMVIAKTLAPLYGAVTKNSWKPLFDHYDQQLKSDLLARQAFQVMGGDRLASWNFEHITDPCGTIEFRRSPGVDSAAKAKHWVNFTLGFMYQAAKTNVNWAALAAEKKHPSVADLANFVKAGVQGLEPTCSALGPIVEDKSPPTVFSAPEIAKKKAKLMARKSPYVEAVNRTPPGTPLARSPANSRANTPTGSRPTTANKAPSPAAGAKAAPAPAAGAKATPAPAAGAKAPPAKK